MVNDNHIAIEGTDCAGKDTICEELNHILANSEIVFEPGCTPVGDELRRICKREHPLFDRVGALELNDNEQLALMFTSRSQLCRSLQARSNEVETTYIWNRCFVSSYVYQVLTGKGSFELFHQLMSMVTVKPKHVFVLNPTEDEYLRRVMERGNNEDDPLGKRALANRQQFFEAYKRSKHMCKQFGVQLHVLEPNNPDPKETIEQILTILESS